MVGMKGQRMLNWNGHDGTLQLRRIKVVQDFGNDCHAIGFVAMNSRTKIKPRAWLGPIENNHGQPDRSAVRKLGDRQGDNRLVAGVYCRVAKYHWTWSVLRHLCHRIHGGDFGAASRRSY